MKRQTNDSLVSSVLTQDRLLFFRVFGKTNYQMFCTFNEPDVVGRWNQSFSAVFSLVKENSSIHFYPLTPPSRTVRQLFSFSMERIESKLFLQKGFFYSLWHQRILRWNLLLCFCSSHKIYILRVLLSLSPLNNRLMHNMKEDIFDGLDKLGNRLNRTSWQEGIPVALEEEAWELLLVSIPTKRRDAWYACGRHRSLPSSSLPTKEKYCERREERGGKNSLRTSYAWYTHVSLLLFCSFRSSSDTRSITSQSTVLQTVVQTADLLAHWMASSSNFAITSEGSESSLDSM